MSEDNSLKTSNLDAPEKVNDEDLWFGFEMSEGEGLDAGEKSTGAWSIEDILFADTLETPPLSGSQLRALVEEYSYGNESEKLGVKAKKGGAVEVVAGIPETTDDETQTPGGDLGQEEISVPLSKWKHLQEAVRSMEARIVELEQANLKMKDLEEENMELKRELATTLEAWQQDTDLFNQQMGGHSSGENSQVMLVTGGEEYQPTNNQDGEMKDIEESVGAVLEAGSAWLSGLASSLKPLVFGEPPVEVNAGMVGYWEKWQALLNERYDRDNEAHEAELMKLWHEQLPGVELKERVGFEWSRLGFQGNDPATDFRGPGMLGLFALNYLASEYHELAHAISESRSVRENNDYPYSIAVINVVGMLIPMIELRKPLTLTAFDAEGDTLNEPQLVSEEAQGFLSIVRHTVEEEAEELVHLDKDCFGEVMSLSFFLLDRVWTEERATYMEFNQILEAVKEKVGRALRTRPKSVEEFRIQLEK